jgi:hypothetical protein
MPPQRRRVCFVLPSLNGGGAERAAVQVLNGLDRTLWDRSMFLFERTGPYLADLDPSIDLHAASAPARGERCRCGGLFATAARRSSWRF